jgi:hypothetical protein
MLESFHFAYASTEVVVYLYRGIVLGGFEALCREAAGLQPILRTRIVFKAS